MPDDLTYAGKRVIVTGAASGMGEACARLLVQLDAEVWGLDIKPVSAPVKEFVETDLRDPDAIEWAVSRVGEPVDALFNCAGLPGPPFSKLDTMLVNFLGLRHLTERAISRMRAGGAIASVSSVAGMGYLTNLANVKQLLEASEFGAARAWCEAYPDIANGYPFSKECIIVYTLMRGRALAERGIRINCISPGITDTPMLPHFYEQTGREWIEKNFQGFLGRNARPGEQAWPLVFLNSQTASFVTGANLFVDGGYTGALFTGQVSAPAPQRRTERPARARQD